MLISRAQAELWNQALPADPQLLHADLVVENPTQLNTTLWIQLRSGDSIGETKIDLPALTTFKSPMKKWNEQQVPFSIKSFNDKLKVSLEMRDGRKIPFSSKVALRWHSTSSFYGGAELNESQAKGLKHEIQKIHVLNLSPRAQTLRLVTASGLVKKFSTKNYYDSSTLELSIHEPFQISGPGRFQVLLETQNNFIQAQPVPTSPKLADLPQGGAFFLMSSQNLQDSFVIHISDDLLIKEAREAIAEKQPKILIAKINGKPESWNRAFSKDTSAPPWSWSVDEVEGFADIASIECDGHARLVEERLINWLAAKRICFWKTYPVHELSPTEIISGQLKKH